MYAAIRSAPHTVCSERKVRSALSTCAGGPLNKRLASTAAVVAKRLDCKRPNLLKLCPIVPVGLTRYSSASASKPSRRSEEHTSELQSLMRISYAVFCLKKKKTHTTYN